MREAVSKHKLLLVDGDPKSQRVLEVSLKKAGFDVITSATAEEALQRLAEGVPELIVSDTQFPGMDGFEFCRRIKERPELARIPFLFVSSKKSIEDKIRGLELGVEDYLNKPIYIKEITTRVRMLLQRKQRESLESSRDTRTRFTGALSDIGVVDLVQTIDVNRKTGIIHIHNSDGHRGAIYFRDGRTIDAEAGRLTGIDAVYRLFSWNDGTFEVEFKPLRRRDVIDLSAQAVLMEGMRRLDEWTHLLEALPPLHTVFEVDYHVLAERLADIPDEVNRILRLFDGRRTFMQVVEDSDFPDLEAAAAIAHLYHDQVVYEPSGERLPVEVRGSMGRLERWLAESPWAAEVTPPVELRPTPVPVASGTPTRPMRTLSSPGDPTDSTPGQETLSGYATSPYADGSMEPPELGGPASRKARINTSPYGMDAVADALAGLPEATDDLNERRSMSGTISVPDETGPAQITETYFSAPLAKDDSGRKAETVAVVDSEDPGRTSDGLDALDADRTPGPSVEYMVLARQMDQSGSVPDSLQPSADELPVVAEPEALESDPEPAPEQESHAFGGEPFDTGERDAVAAGLESRFESLADDEAKGSDGGDAAVSDGADAVEPAADPVVEPAADPVVATGVEEAIVEKSDVVPDAENEDDEDDEEDEDDEDGEEDDDDEDDVAASDPTASGDRGGTSLIYPVPGETGELATKGARSGTRIGTPAPSYAKDSMDSMTQADMLEELGQPSSKRVPLMIGGALGVGAALWYFLSSGTPTLPAAHPPATTEEAPADELAHNVDPGSPAELPKVDLPATTPQQGETTSTPEANTTATPEAASAAQAAPAVETAHAETPGAKAEHAATPEAKAEHAATPEAKAEHAPTPEAKAEHAPTPAAEVAPAVSTAAPAGDAKSLGEACAKAYKKQRYRDIVDSCVAFAAVAPEQAAAALVNVAHAELERGNTKKALEWAEKAVATDATMADAWVFIGGAQQELGDAAAAKAAYTKYLELAPTGKYARDLRIIVNGM
jgi:CheY-like chemotaxis protein